MLLQAASSVVVHVSAESGPIDQAEIVVRGDISGSRTIKAEATIQIPAGETEVIVQRYGFTRGLFDFNRTHPVSMSELESEVGRK